VLAGGRNGHLAPQCLEYLERLADLDRGLARLQIHDEAEPHTACAGQLILPEALGLADTPDEGAEVRGGEGSWNHEKGGVHLSAANPVVAMVLAEKARINLPYSVETKI
jgi:hypothetical protein